MHIIKNSLICFAMVSVLAIQNAQSQEQVKSEKLLKTGIGFQLGVRFHQPDQINDFITDIYNAYVSEYVEGPIEKKTLGPGAFLSINGTFDIGPLFSAVPFVQSMWAGKQLYISGGPAGNIHVNSYTAMGGLNLFVRVLNQDSFKLRIGAGVYGTYTYVQTTGDVPHRRIGGSGAGGRGILGSEYRLNDKITLTLDCGVSFGKSKLYIGDPLKISGRPIVYPTKLDHLGFELTPGVMFYF